MLTIKNIQTIIGQEYNDTLNIIGVKEHTHHYEFTLGHDVKVALETILLHRIQTDNGMYVMEYDNKTLWLNTNEFDTTEKIIICMQTI